MEGPTVLDAGISGDMQNHSKDVERWSKRSKNYKALGQRYED